MYGGQLCDYPAKIHRIYCYLGLHSFRSEDSIHLSFTGSVLRGHSSIHPVSGASPIISPSPHSNSSRVGPHPHVWLDRGVSDSEGLQHHMPRSTFIYSVPAVYIRTANHGEGRCHRFDHLYSPRRIQYSPPSSLNWRSRT